MLYGSTHLLICLFVPEPAGVLNSESWIGQMNSAIIHLYEKNHWTVPDLMRKGMADGRKSFKKICAKSKQEAHDGWKPGKKPFHLNGYIETASRALSSASNFYLHPFITFGWNLSARSDNVSGILWVYPCYKFDGSTHVVLLMGRPTDTQNG